MKHFDNDFAGFFTDLEKNNNRDWFIDNKKRYESSVKDPFHRFVEDLIGRLSEIYPSLTIQPKDTIFRINRDIRFSPDKTPYKIQMSALISEGGKKDKTTPGFYVQASHKDIRVYSGCHVLDKDQLASVRTLISENLEEFKKLISNKNFVDTFGDILGEKNKRLSPEFAALEEKQPLIANKSFYYFFKYPSSSLTKDDLVDKLMAGYKNALPLNRFFERAF